MVNPADDYVAAFVKDVNRAKVLRAKTIMLSPDKYTANGKGSGETHKVLENSFIEEFCHWYLKRGPWWKSSIRMVTIWDSLLEKELGQTLSKT